MLEALRSRIGTTQLRSHATAESWSEGLRWVHVVSDATTGAACVALALVAASRFRRRLDWRTPRVVWLFCGWLLISSAARFVDAAQFWSAWPAISGALKAGTAVFSCAALVALLRTSSTDRRSAADGEEEIGAAVALEQPELLRAVIEASPTAFVLVAEDGAIRLANGAACRLFGWDLADLVGADVERLVPESHRAGHRALRAEFVRRPVRGRMSPRREVPALHRDGSTFPTSIELTPVETPAGPCVLASIEDLRERNRSALESERHFRDIANSLPRLVWTLEPEGSCDFVNRKWIEYTGQAAAPSPHDAWRASFHPEDFERLSSAWRECVRTGGDLSVELRVAGRGGRYRWFDARASAQRDAEGEVVRWIGSCADIHEQRELREALRSTAAIVESSHDAIIGFSLDDRVTTWNAAAERIYGYSADEIIGQAVSVLAPEDRMHEHLRYMERVRNGESTKPYDTVRRCRDGSLIEVSITISPVYDAEGAVVGASKLARDITERRRNERRLLQVTDELRRSNADLEQFASAASHDLQEPVRMITIYLQKLELSLAERLDPKSRDYLGTSMRAAARMKELIAGLLSYSRLRSGAVERTTVDLNSVLTAVRENLAQAISDSGATIQSGRLPVVRADRTQMLQLFQNLIGNALKFRGDAAPLVQLDARRCDRGWEIRVADNGIGIEPAHHERIFEVFKRLHSASEYPGTGIGLALCKRIVERHSGELRIESELGRGATFVVVLPESILP